MKVNAGIDEIIQDISDTWKDKSEDEHLVKIYVGKDENGNVTNYIELVNGPLGYIGTGIGGFKIYLEQLGGFCPDIVVNGTLVDEVQKKALIEAVLDGKYLRLNDED